MTDTTTAPTGALTVNGERLDPAPATVLELVAARTGRDLAADGTPAAGGPLGVAVALNGAVVARSRWAATPLSAGDAVELLTAVQGG